MRETRLLNHPDKEEIIQRLLAGVSPNSVYVWLQEKYPTKKDYHLSVSTLSNFRKDYLNLDREATRAIKMEMKKKKLGLPHNPDINSFKINAFKEIPDETDEMHALRVKSTLLQSPTYREKLKNITEATLDGPRLIKELVSLLQSRLEVYFNEVATASTAGESLRADKMFAEYVSLMKDLIKDSKKIEDDYNAQPEDGTIQLNVVHEQVGIIRETIKELLVEFQPELALEFMDRLNKKMSVLKYNVVKPPNVLERVDKLNKQIKEIQERGNE